MKRKVWNKGKSNIYSKETLLKMSLAKKGKKLSLETRKKMSESRKKKVGELAPAWKGGKKSFYWDNARKIMGEHLGRELKKGEVVHHLDCNPLNNKIENLHLFPNHSEHRKYHLKLRRIVKKHILKK